MPEPFFPPPTKRESTPYRTGDRSAARPMVGAVRAPVVGRPADPPKLKPNAASAEPQNASFVTTFLVRLGLRAATLAIVLGVLYVLVWAGEGGAKWPRSVALVLVVAAVFASPFLLFVRIRRLWRLFFARERDS